MITYGLCPFADHPFWESRLRLSIVWGNYDEEVAMAVVYELVLWSDDSNARTTVMNAPEYHPDDFKRYMLLVQYIKEDVMDKLNLIRNALFNPRFVFNGSGITVIGNHTT